MTKKQTLITIRIPDALKEKMKKVPVNWSEFVRSAIERRLRIEERRRTFAEVKTLLREVPPAPSGFTARSVREDRERG